MKIKSNKEQLIENIRQASAEHVKEHLIGLIQSYVFSFLYQNKGDRKSVTLYYFYYLFRLINSSSKVSEVVIILEFA